MDTIKVKDALCLYQQALITIGRYRETSQKAQHELDYAEAKCRYKIGILSEVHPEVELDISEISTYRKIYTILRVTAEMQNKHILGMSDIRSFQIESELKPDNVKGLLEEKYVEVKLEEDGIFIRLPMIWSRNRAENVSMDRFVKLSLRSIMYRDVLKNAIKNASGFDQYPFENYRYKTINYIFVYPRKGMNQLFIADTDNHETKSITDAICDYLPHRDSGLYSDFFFTTIATDTIPEGTYITVFPQNKMLQTEEQLIDYWSKQDMRS